MRTDSEMFFLTVLQTLREQHGMQITKPEQGRKGIERARQCGLSSRDCADTIASFVRAAIAAKQLH